MSNHLYNKKDWIIRAFSITREDQSNAVNDYPLKLNSTQVGYFFLDPESGNKIQIEDAVIGQPLFTFKDKITLEVGEYPNLKERTETSIGNVLINFISIYESFGTKIPFITGKFFPSDVEKIISKRLKTYPGPDSVNEENIYPFEYARFVDSLNYLTGLSQLCVHVNSERTIVAPTGLKEFKLKLLKEYEGQLHDPVKLAEFESKLLAFDAEYLKGDPAADDFVKGEKLRNLARKKLYLEYGSDPGFKESNVVDPIINSLEEGWDPEKLPALINNLRVGSYNRGAQTALGGEMTKWLFRVSGGVSVTKEDCGTKLGFRRLITESNYKKLVNLYVVGKEKSLLIDTEDKAKVLIGKNVVVRSPMYCSLDKTNYCRCCMGEVLGSNPSNIPTAVAEYGSIIMYVFMKSFHAKALTLKKLELDKYLT